MKNLRKIKVAICIISILVLLPSVIKFPDVKADDTVRLLITPQPYIDVVLSKEKTSTDLSNFEGDLLNKLAELNIKTENVKVSGIETYSINMQESFEWDKDVSSSIGSISIGSNGKNVTMTGNKANAGKNAMWIIPEKDLDQEFTFNYNIDYGDSFSAAGMLLRVQREGNTLSGYALSFNKSGKDWYSGAGNQLGAIWSFTYGINQHSTLMKKTLIKAVPIAQSGTLTVKATKTEIEISGGGLSQKVVCDLEKPMGAGFGFFSEHYSHNCSTIGSFALKDINLATESFKSFEEVLRAPEWRKNSLKVLVDVNDISNEELNKPATLGETFTRVINDEVHYLGWGKDVNKSQMESFIASNNNNGLFIDNTDYQNSINQTAQYINNFIQNMQSTNYIILGENRILTNTNPSIMTNTAGGKYPYGRWKVVHDYKYYENNIGQFAESGKYISNMITVFDKTGKYEVYYEDRQVQPTEIYVHRRPVAKINLVRTENQIELTSSSYDLDSYSRNNGIQEEEWTYKKVGESGWQTGKLTDVSDEENYIIQLRVLDWQNTWSKPTTRYITSDSTVKPVADFDLSKEEYSIYEELEIDDRSYDPYGGKITSEKWTVYKDDTEIYTDSSPLKNYQSYETGTYQMSLEVTNDRDMVSEVFSRSFKIIPDNKGPECIITPVECDWREPIDVTIEFTDELGSGFKDYQYAVTQNQSSPSQWSSKIAKQKDTITIGDEGIWYLHVKATDNAGNVSEERITGPYKIDKIAPTAEITPTMKDWTKDNIAINLKFEDTQSGFKSYQYAVTASEAEVSSWSAEIEKQTDSITINDEGIWYLHVRATDNSGNVSEEKITGPYKIDRTVPTVEVNPTTKDWTKNDITINLKFEDAQSGFKSYKYAVTTSEAEVNSWSAEIEKQTDSITISDGGIWYLHIKTTDNTGNVSEDIVNGPYKIDKAEPIGRLSHTPTEWVIDNVTINWNFTDTQSDMDHVLLPDGTMTNETSGEYVVGENGEYTFKAYDKVGNERVITEEINNIDKIAPEGVLSVSNSELTDNPIEVLWEAYDTQSGFDRIILPDSSISNNITGSFTVSKMGKYTFFIYDKVGNKKEISIQVNNVDMEKPTLAVTQKVTQWTNEDVVLDWEAKDNESGLAEVVFPNSKNINKSKGEYVVTQNGIYAFLAYDKIGNGIMVKHTVNNVDKTGPLLKLKRDYDSDDNIKIMWEMSDTQSGIRNLVLPNGRITTEKTGEFIVNQNGGYTFIAYDNVGNDTVMKVEISNIDKEAIKFDLWQEKLDDERYRINWKILEGQDDFKYILLPSNTYSENEQGNFIVKEEGEYEFLAYDGAGNETRKTIKIIK